MEDVVGMQLLSWLVNMVPWCHFVNLTKIIEKILENYTGVLSTCGCVLQKNQKTALGKQSADSFFNTSVL